MMQPLHTYNYQHIVVLTGAGVSQASGIPTFRGPQGQISDAYMRVADGRNVATLLPEMWATHGAARGRLVKVAPNPSHVTLANWENKWREDNQDREITVVTQNVDGLHQLAGSQNVIEIHGSLRRSRCTNADCSSMPFVDFWVPSDEFVADPNWEGVPHCQICDANLRPDITLFNESLPVDELHRVKRALRDCDLFLAVGTSGVVAPASEFVRGAAYNRARTIMVNLTPMETCNPYFEEEYLGRAEEVLPQLLD